LVDSIFPRLSLGFKQDENSLDDAERIQLICPNQSLSSALSQMFNLFSQIVETSMKNVKMYLFF